MRLRKPCEHNLYDEHPWGGYSVNDLCPGGEFLPEDALVIEKGADGEWPDDVLDIVWRVDGPLTWRQSTSREERMRWFLDGLVREFAADQVGEPG